jgi:transposase
MILGLARQGLTVAAIARRTGHDRKTVRKYVARGLEPPACKPRAAGPSLLRPFEAYLRERVARFPELTGRRLWREVRGLGFEGGYSTVTEFLRGVRPPPEPAAFERRFETPPGRQAQVDFAFFKVRFEAEPDAERVVWLFSLVLGHNGRELRAPRAAAAAGGGTGDALGPGRSVADVAFGWGFEDLRMFGQALQRVYGLSPGEALAMARAGTPRLAG